MFVFYKWKAIFLYCFPWPLLSVLQNQFYLDTWKVISILRWYEGVLHRIQIKLFMKTDTRLYMYRCIGDGLIAWVACFSRLRGLEEEGGQDSDEGEQLLSPGENLWESSDQSSCRTAGPRQGGLDVQIWWKSIDQKGDSMKCVWTVLPSGTCHWMRMLIPNWVLTTLKVLCSLKIMTSSEHIKVTGSKVTNHVVHDDVSFFLGDVFMPQLDSFLPGEPETSRMLLWMCKESLCFDDCCHDAEPRFCLQDNPTVFLKEPVWAN